MVEENESVKVFICYSKQDFKEAQELFDQLKDAGADPWMDKNKLVLGDDWEHEIKNAVAKSDAFLVCLRPGFNDTGFRQREVRWAREAWELRPPGRGFIIPFIVQPCQFSDLPEWCTPIHVGSDLTARTNFDEVLRALEKHQGWRSRTGPEHGTASATATQYTDGDWITAAIVARERAETELKKVASRAGKSPIAEPSAEPDRSRQRETIVNLLQIRIRQLLEKHAQGGQRMTPGSKHA